jgi:hypothetical protein
MNSLSSKHQSFIMLMKESEEHESRGFELLLKRDDLTLFFDGLAAEGLFEPSRNPGPIASDKPGTFRVPYWPPVDYLEVVAKRATDLMDTILTNKVMGVIRDVSTWRDTNGRPRDNYRTWHSFAKIFEFLPPNAITLTDIEMIPTWLSGQFDQTITGHALATGVLPRFLASNDPQDWLKACRILYHCTALEPVDGRSSSEDATTEVRTVVKDHWLKEFIDTSAATLGKKARQNAADVFLTRLNGVYSHAMGGGDTWLFRPAIEDHEQNYEWRGAYNRFVEGLRDCLLAWIDSDAESARPYIRTLLSSGSEIVERVAIHLADQRFERLRELIPQCLSAAFFNAGHRHELRLLLKNHFPQFSEGEKIATLEAVHALPLPERGNDPERILLSRQQSWLSALAGHDYRPADAWLTEVNSALGTTEAFPNPDFNSYHSMRWGFGPTPHKVAELVAFAEAGSVVAILNAFVPSDDWDSPSKRSLSDALIDAVADAPEVFADLLPQFLTAKPEYQYAVIAGFKRLWDAWDGKEDKRVWANGWRSLFDLFESLLNDNSFWRAEVTEEPVLSPTRDWIPPIVSEFLSAGMRNDDKAYSPDLLDRTRRLIVTLLGKSEAQSEPREGDALNGAINTAKGKAIEALFDYALRCCRLSDKAKHIHADAWLELQPLFDAELAQCRDANFEFSAIAGTYMGNLQYMSAPWVAANMKEIFNTEFPANCFSALDGLAFANLAKSAFAELINSGAVDWALRKEMKGTYARESLLQRIALAYLWDQEKLNGPRFSYLFSSHKTSDLGIIARYFWQVHGQKLADDQTERIFLFWERCVNWSDSDNQMPTNLLSTLSLLSSYLNKIDNRALTLLLAVAPYTTVDYNSDRFIDELSRLAANNPFEVSKVLVVLFQTYQPTYDFQDQIKKLILLLAADPGSRPNAILISERIRHLPGMVQLYSELTAATSHVG